MGPRAGLEVVEREKKLFYPCWESKAGRPARRSSLYPLKSPDTFFSAGTSLNNFTYLNYIRTHIPSVTNSPLRIYVTVIYSAFP
jgi:hypothetical protein